MSWTLYEAVTFDDTRITSIDWQDLSDPALQCGARPASRVQHHQPGPEDPSWAAARKPGRGRPRPSDSRTPLPTPPGNGCAILPLTRKKSRTRLMRERHSPPSSNLVASTKCDSFRPYSAALIAAKAVTRIGPRARRTPEKRISEGNAFAAVRPQRGRPPGPSQSSMENFACRRYLHQGTGLRIGGFAKYSRQMMGR